MAAQWEDRYLLLSWIFMFASSKRIEWHSQNIFFIRVMWMIHMSEEKKETDKLYNALNLYQQNIKLTLELDPIRFPDTEII